MADPDPSKKPNPSASASTQDVANAFGVSKEAVFAWKAKIERTAGIWRFVKGGKGRAGQALEWDLPRVIAWRMEREVETAVGRVKAAQQPTDLVVMTPLDREQLRKVKMHNDQMARTLVDRAELDRQWAKAGAELKQRLETVGRRHGVAVTNDLARAMTDLERTIHGVMGKA